ncbi:MAG: hypothetical protein D6722_26465 [Bacteroidetes bacterium]|nr:MAG: hypothetical protein D6722_26465 [Bacteroidota bacterium]
MRLSSLLSTTLRQDPADPAPAGMKLLQRAGYLRATSPGRLAWSPLGVAALARLTTHLRAPLDAPQPLILAPEGPAEQGHYFGRYAGGWEAQALEVPLLRLARSEISSYRQLPATLWQQRLVSGRPWLEAWVLTPDEEALEAEMSRLQEAYSDLLTRWDLPGQPVAMLPNLLGSALAWTWASPHPEGSLRLHAGQMDSRLASLIFAQGAPAADPMAPVETPDVQTIAELAAFLQISPAETAKVVCYRATCAGHTEPQLLMVVIRGDLEVNEAAVARRVGATTMEPASEADLREVGAVPGYASPVGLSHPRLRVLADTSVVAAGGLVAGANKAHTHLKQVQYGRDYEAELTGNIHQLPAEEETLPARPLGRLEAAGTALAEGVGASCMSSQGRPEPLALGYVGWDLTELMTALCEVHHDEEGLSWPAELAPFDLALISLADGEETIAQAEHLYAALLAAGFRVLYDDRAKKAAGPGVRFKDADLRGVPLRITLGRRALSEGGAEWKARGGEPDLISVDQILARLQAWRTAFTD